MTSQHPEFPSKIDPDTGKEVPALPPEALQTAEHLLPDALGHIESRLVKLAGSQRLYAEGNNPYRFEMAQLADSIEGSDMSEAEKARARDVFLIGDHYRNSKVSAVDAREFAPM